MSDMEAFVNALAEKLDLAIDKAQPLAEEIVRQYVLQETVLGFVSAAFALGGIVALILGIRWMQRNPGWIDGPPAFDPVFAVIATVGGAFTILAGVTTAITHFIHSIAPLPNMLGL